MSEIFDEVRKGIITFLAIAVVFALLQRYTGIYIDTLVFIRNNIVNVSSKEQEFIANVVTLVIHILSFGVMGCAYWSHLRFEVDKTLKAYLPLIIGGLPMLFILLAWLKVTSL